MNGPFHPKATEGILRRDSIDVVPERRMVRLPGIAPGHIPWRGIILLLNHNRGNQKGRKPAAAGGRPQGPSGPCHFNKEQTPLGDLFDPNPRFHGGCFGV
jgi:hypothetical protein